MKSRKFKRAKNTYERTLPEHDLPAGQSLATSVCSLPSNGRNWIPALVVVITFLTFLPVLKNGFIDWDRSTIVDNLSYRGFGLRELDWVMASFHFGQYQPFVWFTFALDYVLWWMDPFGYHWTSLFLHIASAVVFYHVAYRLTLLSGAIEASAVLRSAPAAAGLATLLFAVHPLRVEPVAWAFGRAEILSALLVLLSVYYYLRANDSNRSTGPSESWMRLSVCAYVCSLLAGPAGIMLPIVFLVLDTYPLRRSNGLASPFRPELRHLYREKTPYFLAAVVFSFISLIARAQESTVALPYNVGIVDWILYQLAAPAFYLWKAVLPVSLSPAYELQGWPMAFSVFGSILLCIATVGARKRWPALTAAWLCYLLFLLPVFRVDFPAHQILADRYTHLAALPWSALIGAAALQYSQARPVSGTWPARLGVGIAVSSVIALAFFSSLQVPIWRDTETLWRNAVATTPNSRAYSNLASLSEVQGEYDDAVAYYQRVAEIDTQRWDAHEKAARLLQKRGKIAEAVEHYRIVVQLNPSALEARENLAAGLVNLGHVDEAVQHFRKLLELAPERNDARLKLGTILAVEGRAGEATEVLRAAAKADPTDGKNFLRLGQVLAAQGKLDEAVHYFREATRLSPEDAETHENLGHALLELGKKEEAGEHLREALRILRSTPTAR